MLSGPIGGRTQRAVALVTEDFRLYHRLVPFFEAHGVDILGLRPADPVPASVRVLLDGPAADARSIPVRGDVEATWLAVQEALDPRPRLRHVTVGVDPGLKIGMAVLVDGEVYWVAECNSPEEAVERMVAWRTGLGEHPWSVRVGDGSPDVGSDVVGLVAARLPDVEVLVVPETASTPGSPLTLSRHTDAAVRIARRSPART